MNIVNVEKDRIFISIANYRDPEIFPTVRDLFEKARFPERLKVGIFTQIDFSVDDPRTMVHGSDTNVREVVIDSRESKGCCWARSHILTNIRKDEEFVLQIDAHTRFAKDWDIEILNQFRMLPHYDCVLTSYPLAYHLDRPIDYSPKHVLVKFRDWHSTGLPVFMADMNLPAKAFPLPSPGIGLSAGCLFGPSSIFDRIPYDPHIYFFGEEQDLAIRMYTHGIDLYAPSKMCFYHLYANDVKDKKVHWEDHRHSAEIRRKVTVGGTDRVMYKLGLNHNVDDVALMDIGKYSLGRVRSIEKWQAVAGVNLAEKRLTDTALTGSYWQPNIYE